MYVLLISSCFVQQPTRLLLCRPATLFMLVCKVIHTFKPSNTLVLLLGLCSGFWVPPYTRIAQMSCNVHLPNRLHVSLVWGTLACAEQSWQTVVITLMIMSKITVITVNTIQFQTPCWCVAGARARESGGDLPAVYAHDGTLGRIGSGAL